MPDPAEPFEAWLLPRVADAVEGGEVSATLLTELHAAIAATRERPSEDRHVLALMERAERIRLPVDRLTELLATLDAQPTVTRERVLRRFVEAWLMHQREACEDENQGGCDGEGPRGGRHAVPLEEVVLAQAFQLEALLNVMERQDVKSTAEVLKGCAGHRAKTVKAQ
jgi:hypothetical protein